MRAVRYLAIHGGRESRAALADIYASSTDVDMKKRILSAFMQGGEKDRAAHRGADASRTPSCAPPPCSCSATWARTEELWALYQKESAVDVKKGIIRALFTGGSVTRLTELAQVRAESRAAAPRRPQPRRHGQQAHGRRPGRDLQQRQGPRHQEGRHQRAVPSRTTPKRWSRSPARSPDPAMKKDMVSKLSNMRSKVATDYLLEILNK